VTVPLEHVVASELTSRVYGTVAVGQLEALGHLTEVESAAWARHFRVVGSSASLVMLESEPDYLELGLRPEDDAGVVRDRAATTILDATRDRIASELTEPRARFMAWFDRLENQPGFMFYPTDELR